jgi:hypothetical protein
MNRHDDDKSTIDDRTSIFDLKDPHPERAVKPDPEQKKLQAQLDKALKDSFPASDPVAVSQPTKTGSKRPSRKTPT